MLALAAAFAVGLGIAMIVFGIGVARRDENAYSMDGRPGPPLWCEFSLGGASLVVFGVVLLGYIILKTG